MTWFTQMLIGAAGLNAGIAMAGCAYVAMRRHQVSERRAASMRSALESSDSVGEYNFDDVVGGSACLRYMRRLSMQLATGARSAISSCVRHGRAASSQRGLFFQKHALAAGLEGAVSVEGFCDTGCRLCLAGGAIGALLGIVVSNELGALLGIGGSIFGYAAPFLIVCRREGDRKLEAGRHLSEMLEVVALGLRSGLTFDRSFALYGQHFDSEFAQSCTAIYRRWSLGLSTREEALRLLAQSYSCKQLEQIVESVIRSLKLGSALAGPFEEYAEQARASYRTELEEHVAKAPVKMMLPTGTLILPAMLLLVIGPILLELAQGF